MRRAQSRIQGSEGAQKQPAGCRADAGDVVEAGGSQRAPVACAVAGNAEPVRFIADAVEKQEGGVISFQFISRQFFRPRVFTRLIV